MELGAWGRTVGAGLRMRPDSVRARGGRARVGWVGGRRGGVELPPQVASLMVRAGLD